MSSLLEKHWLPGLRWRESLLEPHLARVAERSQSPQVLSGETRERGLCAKTIGLLRYWP